jgi:hypothetical protein
MEINIDITCEICGVMSVRVTSHEGRTFSLAGLRSRRWDRTRKGASMISTNSDAPLARPTAL